jgi:hypothetical protein
MPEFSTVVSGAFGGVCARDDTPINATQRRAGAKKNFMQAS